MGSRYLLIEFDDDAAADTLRAQIDKATRSGKRFRVLGLFAKPTRLCDCSKWQLADIRPADRQVLGAKLGWWLCRRCKRPRFGDHQLINLLKPHDILEPTPLLGVDDAMSNPQPKEYFFHINRLSITLLPFRLTKKK